MKRTALVVAMLLVVAATFLYLLGAFSVLLFAACTVIVTAFLWILRKHTSIDAKSVFALLAVALISISFYVRGEKINSATAILDGRTLKVEGIVKEEPVQSGDWSSMIVEVTGDNMSDGVKDTKFLLYAKSTSSVACAEVGDIVSAEVTFEKIEEDLVKSYYYKGVYFSSFCRSAEIVGHKTTMYEYFVSARQYIRKTIGRYLSGDSSALLNGLLLGDKSRFSDELYYNFKACGLSHIIAISGLHINVICLALYAVLSKLVGKRKGSLLMFLPLCFTVAVTGFTPSAIRAGIMFGLFLLGRVLLKNPDTLNSLGVAVAVILTLNPYYISNISLQLSVAATAGIILCSPFSDCMAKRLTAGVKQKLLKTILSTAFKIAMLAIAACIFILPFTALYFGFVSVVAPIVSVFVTPAATYTLVLGSLAVTLSPIPFVGYYLAGALFALCDVLAKYMAVVARLGASIPFSYTAVDYKTVYIALAAVLCLAAVWILLNQVGGKRCFAIMSVGLLVLGLVANSVSNINSLQLTVIRNDTASIILVKNGKAAVIGLCEQNRQAVLNVFKLNSVLEVETVISVDENNSRAIEEIRDGFKVDRVLQVTDLVDGYQTDVLKGVSLLSTGEGFEIEYADKLIRFITADTLYEAMNQECDLLITRFSSGNIKVIRNGAVASDEENTLVFKIRKGKDVVRCG